MAKRTMVAVMLLVHKALCERGIYRVPTNTTGQLSDPVSGDSNSTRRPLQPVELFHEGATALRESSIATFPPDPSSADFVNNYLTIASRYSSILGSTQPRNWTSSPPNADIWTSRSDIGSANNKGSTSTEIQTSSMARSSHAAPSAYTINHNWSFLATVKTDSTLTVSDRPSKASSSTLGITTLTGETPSVPTLFATSSVVVQDDVTSTLRVQMTGILKQQSVVKSSAEGTISGTGGTSSILPQLNNSSVSEVYVMDSSNKMSATSLQSTETDALAGALSPSLADLFEVMATSASHETVVFSPFKDTSAYDMLSKSTIDAVTKATMNSFGLQYSNTATSASTVILDVSQPPLSAFGPEHTPNDGTDYDTDANITPVADRSGWGLWETTDSLTASLSSIFETDGMLRTGISTEHATTSAAVAECCAEHTNTDTSSVDQAQAFRSSHSSPQALVISTKATSGSVEAISEPTIDTTNNQTSAERRRTVGIVMAAVSLVGACGGLSIVAARRYRLKKKRSLTNLRATDSSTMEETIDPAASSRVPIHRNVSAVFQGHTSMTNQRTHKGRRWKDSNKTPNILRPALSQNSLGWI